MSGSLLASAALPAFARHETFHPRFGWLRKAVTESAKSGTVFTEKDSTVKLGVGKNMVNAIRYWGLAFKVLEQRPNPGRPRLPTDGPECLRSEAAWRRWVGPVPRGSCQLVAPALETAPPEMPCACVVGCVQ